MAKKDTVLKRYRVLDRKTGGLVEHVYTAIKDVQDSFKGHVVATRFRGDEDNILEQAETDNVIMQWMIDMSQTLPLMLFNMLGGCSYGTLAGGQNAYGYGLGFIGYPGSNYSGFTNELANANLLYTPADWANRYMPLGINISTGVSYPYVPMRYLICSNYDQPEVASERLLPNCGILALADVYNPYYTGFTNLRRDYGYTTVVDKRTIKWVYDFSPASFAGTIKSVHLAEGNNIGTSRQFARALLAAPITKTVDDTFRIQWTFTRDLLPGEPA